MCTAIVRYAPDERWPVMVVFVRDEDRDRTTAPAGPWWDAYPSLIGGRDQRAGGTWLAVDTAPPPALAFLLNRLEPGLPRPMSTGRPTRGFVPLEALAAGASFDPLRDLTSGEQLAPFHLVTLDSAAARTPTWWRWDGAKIEADTLAPGITVIGSRGLMLEGENQRRDDLGATFARVAVPDLDDDAHDPQSAWRSWVEVLDGRSVPADDLQFITVRSVVERPGFGTVGATLVGLAADGRIRYDVNATYDLDPGGWRSVE